MRISQIVEKIKFKRKAKGFSHEEMAFRLEISQAAYTNLENQTSRLSVERLIQIAEVLEEPIVNFFVDSQNSSATKNLENPGSIDKQILDNLIKSKYEQITLLQSLLERKG